MTKQKNLVIATFLVLMVLCIIFTIANMKYIQTAKKAQSEKIITFKEGARILQAYESNIKSFESKTFPAVIRSSGQKPVETEYTGVELKTAIKEMGIDLLGAKQIIIRAADGYTVALSIDEVDMNDNVYIAYAMEGEPLKLKRRGGNGPYQLVIRKDPFSQRWCKYVSEVEVQ